MTKVEKLIEALRANILKKDDGFYPVLQAVVSEVGESTCSVKLVSNDLELEDVLFSATEENEKGFVLVPKLESPVLVGLIGSDENSLYLIKVDEVEKVMLTIEDTTLVVDKDGFIFNEGTNGGMVKAPDLVGKLNDLENSFNALVSEFNTHVHNAPQAPSGTIPTAPPLVASSQNVTPTQAADLENDKITH